MVKSRLSKSKQKKLYATLPNLMMLVTFHNPAHFDCLSTEAARKTMEPLDVHFAIFHIAPDGHTSFGVLFTITCFEHISFVTLHNSSSPAFHDYFGMWIFRQIASKGLKLVIVATIAAWSGQGLLNDQQCQDQ